MSNYSYSNRPNRPAISEEYKRALRDGYFNDGVLKEGFILSFSQELAQSFLNGSLTSAQLRNFYNHVKMACSIYRQKKDREKSKDLLPGQKNDPEKNKYLLLNKIKKLDVIVKYNMSRDGSNIPEAFGDFIALSIEACKEAEDVTEGFAPHFEAIVGYFKYYEKKNEKTRRAR